MRLVVTVAYESIQQKTPSPRGGLGVSIAGLLPATSAQGGFSDKVAKNTVLIVFDDFGVRIRTPHDIAHTANDVRIVVVKNDFDASSCVDWVGNTDGVTVAIVEDDDTPARDGKDVHPSHLCIQFLNVTMATLSLEAEDVHRSTAQLEFHIHPLSIP